MGGASFGSSHVMIYLPKAILTKVTKQFSGDVAELTVPVKKTNLKYIHFKSKCLLLVIVGVETTDPRCEEGKEWLNQLGQKIIEVTGEFKA